jgi:hypothetical protein
MVEFPRGMLGTVRGISITFVSALLWSTGCGNGPNGGAPDANTSGIDAYYTPADAGPVGPADGDGSGTWAMLTITLAQVQGFGGAQVARSTFLQEMTQTETELSGTETMCSLEIDSVDGYTQTRVTPDFIASIPPEERTGRITPDGAGGYDYVADKIYILRGVTLEDEANDPLPTDPEDPRIGDWDGDDNPGVTLLITGLLSGKAYVIQRDHTRSDGKQVNANRIEGLITWGGEQVYLGSDPEAIADLASEAFPDPDPNEHTFQLVRIPPDAGCDYIAENRCDLFSE